VQTDSNTAKQTVREMVWGLLERERVALPPGAHGRIPHFAGAKDAADQLAALDQWDAARVVKVNADDAQLPVRARALAANKRVYMSVPKLADENPFYLLDHADVSPSLAASTAGAAGLARKVAVADLPPVDIVVCGSVAVNRQGVRIGNGAGYADLEVALLTESGLVGPSTVIVTTVHPLQVVDGTLPETEHDFRVDLIVTPHEVIECGPHHRPPGLIWDHLDTAKIAAIPVLAARARGEVA
jgi:5-formyltetrahydrofolate cyclo-ligase